MTHPIAFTDIITVCNYLIYSFVCVSTTKCEQRPYVACSLLSLSIYNSIWHSTDTEKLKRKKREKHSINPRWERERDQTFGPGPAGAVPPHFGSLWPGLSHGMATLVRWQTYFRQPWSEPASPRGKATTGMGRCLVPSWSFLGFSTESDPNPALGNMCFVTLL